MQHCRVFSGLTELLCRSAVCSLTLRKHLKFFANPMFCIFCGLFLGGADTESDRNSTSTRFLGRSSSIFASCKTTR